SAWRTSSWSPGRTSCRASTRRCSTSISATSSTIPRSTATGASMSLRADRSCCGWRRGNVETTTGGNAVATQLASGQAHPYMAISPPAVVRELLDETGVDEIADLFEQIPAEHRLARPLELPPAIRSEGELRRHLTDILSRSTSCADNLSFLGGGCWQHYVPA